ncbi:Glutamine amidotransferase domain protein [Aspergillus parasiticus SU-1]|uniref:Glutamine amidotransferase domain protein n=1 Tax=Aspergillus parasiticus (strain ATCC 56775 / NRRL 5862 / SRRC 143 / SU-1) TaxID=1403190 RepID=A0A0F0IMI6_ASPPU|nr:Glutamine amidotransferase domain protein [Aspergillus parasiticus SU-1]
MCGLTAFLTVGGTPGCVHCANNGPGLEKQLEDSLDLVNHRGPDARGRWFSPDYRVGLGHVRLSIVDLSPAGNQPFHDSEGAIHAVVNGELYDHEEYRTELAQEYDFKSNSDCEIVIALYRHYGISFLNKLRGEFALVLYDANRKLFLTARDRYGIKSLYYTMVGNRLLVATEMKSFLPFGWKPEWDVTAIREGVWMNGSQMLFKGVQRLAPGQYMVSQNFNPPEVGTYWDTDYPDKKTVYPHSEEEVIERVRELMLDAVRVRLRADVGLGIYLSGGLDSSAIAGMAVKLVQEGTKLGNDTSGERSKIDCFTVQFEKDSGFDESDIARRTAEWLGVGYHPVYLDEEAIAARLEDTVWHSETPAANVNGMGRLAVAEAAHAMGKKVILTGEGADEHFSGYSDLLPNFLLEPDYSWPQSLAKQSDFAEAWKVMEERNQRLAMGMDEVAGPTKRMLNNTTLCARLSTFTTLPYSSWTDQLALRSPATAFAENFGVQVLHKMMEKWHPLHSTQYQWMKSVLANYILRYIGDNIDMVHQIETRPPFLDHYVTEYANNIPPSLKIKYDPESKTFREKNILREALKPFVTEEIYNRTKHPFVGPFTYQEDGPVHKSLKRLLTEENVNQLGFFDNDRVQSDLVKAFRDKDGMCFQRALAVAQYVVLGQRFGVKKAQDPGCSETSSGPHV